MSFYSEAQSDFETAQRSIENLQNDNATLASRNNHLKRLLSSITGEEISDDVLPSAPDDEFEGILSGSSSISLSSAEVVRDEASPSTAEDVNDEASTSAIGDDEGDIIDNSGDQGPHSLTHAPSRLVPRDFRNTAGDEQETNEDEKSAPLASAHSLTTQVTGHKRKIDAANATITKDAGTSTAGTSRLFWTCRDQATSTASLPEQGINTMDQRPEASPMPTTSALPTSSSSRPVWTERRAAPSFSSLPKRRISKKQR
jgi:hypothetical protein